MTPRQTDWIHARVVARMKELDLSSYKVAQMTDGEVSEDKVRRYVTGEQGMGSAKLQHVLRVLGLTVTRDSV
jgi:hypothetical protein